MINKQNDIVAHGRHIKFLPVNWFYDNVISQPCILNLVISALFQDRPTTLGQKVLDSFFHTEKVNDRKHDDNNLQKNNIFDRFSLRSEEGSFAFLVRKTFCNPFGMLHGGCAAMVAEHAVRQTRKESSIHLQQIDVTYLNGISNGSIANVKLLEQENGSKSNVVHGTIHKQGKCAVQFSMIIG